ncbi:Dihydroorotate dehydrogenase 2 [Mannheimia varigena USDA-ARS-USMARC-1296]|uniref:Dihydroorotate dehydrogenase 2 n=2 Tax=Mannheimia varigena TaxID=85404 RepID=W0Q9N8_9PAST|nr:dihydroorotate dehydrogenase [Mannheimia varigena]AHG75017.1 Dihydroorotate dehydrogenase 2 [Mannheimia varigena USDA-ARS-USMARC-1296]MDY2947498.1 dihydroorotate dehydrogenase [Mannheimia varigena]TLU75153.1 dihydroorotate dehydrogenase [Mannheimia varigena]
MRYKALFSILFSLFLGTANANWMKINDVNYTWGPFNIYHVTLFTETGSYSEGTRPLMLTLQYKKPWEGRDFAASLARTWNNLGIQLPEKEVNEIITHLRKTFPDIKPEDTLHYIALEDRGYFILNDKVVSKVFDKLFNDAIVAIWLDPKMDISRQLLDPSYKPRVEEKQSEQTQEVGEQLSSPQAETTVEINDQIPKVEQAQKLESKQENVENQISLLAENKPIVQSDMVKEESKIEQTLEKKENTKEIQIENPEVFISPIYDDLFMLTRNYV